MHLRIRIVDGDTAGLFLLLLFGIIGGEIGRDAIPRLSVVARTEQKLRADVDSAFFVRAQVDGSVPVEAQLAFAVVGLGLDAAAFKREAIDAANRAALRFGVDIAGIGGVGKNPKATATVEIFPSAVGDSAGIRGVTNSRWEN